MKSLSARLDADKFGWGVPGETYERTDEERTQAVGGWVVEHNQDANDEIGSVCEAAGWSQQPPLAQSTQMPASQAGHANAAGGRGGGVSGGGKSGGRGGKGSNGGKRKMVDLILEDDEEDREPPYKQLNLVNPPTSKQQQQQQQSASETIPKAVDVAAGSASTAADVDEVCDEENNGRSARTEPFHPRMRKTTKRPPLTPIEEQETMTTAAAATTTTTTAIPVTATTTAPSIHAAASRPAAFPTAESFHRVPGGSNSRPVTPTNNVVNVGPSSSSANNGHPSSASTSKSPVPRTSGTASSNTTPTPPTATVAPRPGGLVETSYTRVADLSVNTSVNLFGVVEFVNSAKKVASGRDWSLAFGICDVSSNDVEREKLRCIAFAASRETLPRIEQRGDIIRMHRF